MNTSLIKASDRIYYLPGEDHYDYHGAYDPDRVSSLLHFVQSLDFDTYFLGHDDPDTKVGAIDYIHENLSVETD